MDYEKYMKKCMRLAKKSDGCTSPNPLVGCVVLDKNGKEISTGYHKKCGAKHAEAEALGKLEDEARGGTLFVNLEPCSHFGKTPPCADLIIKKGLKRVVIGMKDPNPIVAGEGINKCRNAGIEVVENVLNDDARRLNEVFIKNMEKKALFVAIKTASTLDGKVATSAGDSKWITSEKARKEVQGIRNRYDAILTTSSTVIKDNPSMDCRKKNAKNPTKIILDRNLRTDFTSKIYTTKGEKIYLVVDEKISQAKISSVPTHVTVIKCPTYNNKLDLKYLFKELYKLGVMSVLVEAGGKLNGELVSLGLVDKIYHFIAPKILGDNSGLSAFSGLDIKKISNALHFNFAVIADFKPDILVVYEPDLV